LKLLIGTTNRRYSHFVEFKENLKNFNIQCIVIKDSENHEVFNIRKIREWLQTKKYYKNIIEKNKPDIVLVDKDGLLSNYALKAHVPLFRYLGGDYWQELEWAKKTIYKNISINRRFVHWQLHRLHNKCFKDATMILPVCKYLDNIVKQHYPNKRTNVFSLGINPELWFPQNGMKLKHPCVGLLQTANIWGKTKEMLLLPKILEAMPDVNFYWAGDGPYRDKILPILEKYDNFKWLGSLEYPNKVREFLTEIDVYALVSGLDMTPNSLLQAQLMKKPVIATNVGGIPEVMVNNETGYLVELGHHEMWIEKISNLITNQQQAKKMGNSGSIFVMNNFSWELAAKNFQSFCKTSQ